MPLTWHQRVLLFPPVLEAYDLLRLVGLRDRLRCPRCKAVGTWKPHGAIYDRRVSGDRPVRRWLCKWCGLYIGPEGQVEAFPNTELGYWDLPLPDDFIEVPRIRPIEALAQALGKTWPWRG